jgi:S1-C subfamily serine protease
VLNDGRSAPARILGQAPCDDLAVLALNPIPTDLHAITMGDSSKARAGQHVTVLGYPSSLQDATQAKVTATEGSVSVADTAAEPDPSLPRYPSLIQHQAPVNPGNSGGPLIDDAARLIGINTLANTLTSGGRAVQGQYYAITTKHVQEVLPVLESGKNVAYVGWELLPVAEYGQEIESSWGLNLPRTDGMFVSAADSGSPADHGQVQAGDQFYSIEDTAVNSVADVCGIVQSRSSGQVLRVHGVYTHGAKDGVSWFADVTL